MSIGLAIDSNSQIPAELIDKYDVEVVPISVSVDGVDYQEGVDLDADGFYALFGEDAPEVTTSQPSPGAFIEAYERLILDATNGDRTLFTTARGVERLWEVSSPLLENPPPVRPYPIGSWGPNQIHQLSFLT